MVIKVLIVDDSVFICNTIRRILDEDDDFKVVDVAHNGLEAVQKAKLYEPDVITMDVEMPLMNGIDAVRKIMAETPTPILMLSAMTSVGAKATLDALAAGAIDFLPKQLENIDKDPKNAKHYLRHRIRIVALQATQIKKLANKQQVSTAKALMSDVSVVNTLPPLAVRKKSSVFRQIQLLVIVASTGGPVAVQEVLSKLPAGCHYPVLIIQHMPATFTRSFAERLNSACQLTVREARQGDSLKPGIALVAPGGLQLILKSVAGNYRVELSPKAVSDIYAPCADVTLSSVAQLYQDRSLTVVLTGMGADGKEGAVLLKRAGAILWAQNEESCVIYGMPKAIVDAKLADRVLSLDEIASEFKNLDK